MIMSLKIPDSLYQHYYDKYGKDAFQAKMKESIEFFKDLDKNDRFVLINGKERRALEAIFEMPIENSTDLARKCQKLANFKIGDIGISFTTDELAQIDAQAGFLGETRETFMTRMAEEIKLRMLERV